MRWLRHVVWLTAVGCYSPHVSGGAPCDPALDNCPTGQSCVLQAGGYFCSSGAPGDAHGDVPAIVDARVDASIDGPPDDVDGDGVKNAMDNCPTTPNPSQANEDGDSYGDACDPCPPDTDNTDTDGDGVGDRCDPHPAAGGDQIALFEGFSAGIPATWMNSSGWTSAGGDAVIVSADSVVSYLGAPVAPVAHGTVSMAFVPQQLFGTGGHGFGVTNPSNSVTGAEGLVCEILTSSGQAPEGGIVNLGTGAPAAQMALTWAVNDAMTVTFTRTDNSFDCVTADTTGGASVDNPLTLTISPANPIIAIRSRSLSGRAHWLMYVTSP